jgi:hypothetical protein
VREFEFAIYIVENNRLSFQIRVLDASRRQDNEDERSDRGATAAVEANSSRTWETCQKSMRTDPEAMAIDGNEDAGESRSNQLGRGNEREIDAKRRRIERQTDRSKSTRRERNRIKIEE